MSALVLGLDFGTDSVRCLLADALDGRHLAVAASPYERWAAGRYSDAGRSQYRQHPRDGIEAMERAVRACLADAGPEAARRVVGLSVDTTGSTPCLTDGDGVPLAMHEAFADDPGAMFVLWKDHTAAEEADRINRVAAERGDPYLAYVGGIYSPEWAVAKAAHILGHGGAVAEAARGWTEHCDFVTNLLTGTLAPGPAKRSRCAAGHKGLWAAEWGGLPDEDFLAAVEPRLAPMRAFFSPETFTADEAIGSLTPEWAERLGLPSSVIVGVGALDAHFGAVGAGIAPRRLARIIGTSTCDIMIAPEDEIGGRTIPGISGQVDGSVVPGMVGLEAGQSAFGDLYAWLARLITAPVAAAAGEGDVRAAVADAADVRLIEWLSDEAAKRDPRARTVLALDWMNGRRTPDVDPRVKGGFVGVDLATDAVDLFAALVEASCFGSRAILERLRASGVAVDEVVSLGGIAGKSPYVMQVMADAMDMPIRVSGADEACALGAAMFASVAAGAHPDIHAAQNAMAQGWQATYTPDAERAAMLAARYEEYRAFGAFEQGRAGSREPSLG